MFFCIYNLAIILDKSSDFKKVLLSYIKKLVNLQDKDTIKISLYNK